MDDLLDKISLSTECFVSYMKSNDKFYKDHKATIINWYLNDNKYKSKTQLKPVSKAKDFNEREYPDNYLTEKYSNNWK